MIVWDGLGLQGHEYEIERSRRSGGPGDHGPVMISHHG